MNRLVIGLVLLGSLGVVVYSQAPVEPGKINHLNGTVLELSGAPLGGVAATSVYAYSTPGFQPHGTIVYYPLKFRHILDVKIYNLYVPDGTRLNLYIGGREAAFHYGETNVVLHGTPPFAVEFGFDAGDGDPVPDIPAGTVVYITANEKPILAGVL